MKRLLITGSRDWVEMPEIYRGFWQAEELLGDHYTVVSGACPTGADALCEAYARKLGLEIERHPAQWRPYGIYNPQAGLLRNQQMVDLGADLCLAFIRNGSPGATHCATRAAAAGIRVLKYTGEEY